MTLPSTPTPTTLKYSGTTKREGVPRQKSSPSSGGPAPPLVAAGYYFCRGLGAEYFPGHDVFFGEEPYLSITFYNRGYAFWAPRQAAVFTLWERGGRGRREVGEGMGEREKRNVQKCLKGGEEWMIEVVGGGGDG